MGESPEVASLDTNDKLFLKEVRCPVHALGPAQLGSFTYSPRMKQWLAENAGRFDFLIMHGIWSWPNLAVRSAARAARRPYGVFVHGALDPWFNRKYPLKKLKKNLYWPLQYPVLRDARAVFFTAPIERDLAVTSFRPSRWNGVVVPYGAGEPEGDPAAHIAEFRDKLPALRDRRFLLFLGRLHEKKGCDLLVQAFCRVASEFPDLDLVMAGPDQGGIEAALTPVIRRAGLESRIHWTGPLRGALKFGALGSADAFILPSHQENFGIAVAESLAAGRPVLISNQVNIWRDILDERVGLVDDDTLEGTERLIRHWMTLPAEQREEMASRAGECFRRRFSIKATVLAIRETMMAPARDALGCIDI